MAATRSAGVLLYRDGAAGLEVLIAHMGGPFWARKDAGAWSIPKGEHDPTESPLEAARREFAEELGTTLPEGEVIGLGEVRQSGGKVVTAFAMRGDLDTDQVISNTFSMEWPRGSGQLAEFPEIDRAEWHDIATARTKLVSGQLPLLDRLLEALNTE